MKKFLFIIFLFSILSCDRDSDVNLEPNLLLNTFPQQTYFVESDSIFFDFTLSAIEGLNSFRMDHLTRGITPIFETALSGTDTRFTLVYVVDSSENSRDSAVITYELLDQNGFSKSGTYNYTVAEPIIIDTVIIGAQNNTTYGNCLSLQDFEVQSISSATLNENNIDLVFYYDTTISWAVMSPDVGASNDTLLPELSNFTTKRQTRFDASIFNANSFTGLSNDGPLVDTDTLPQIDYSDSISQSTVLYFLTQENKKGVLNIRNFSDTLGNFATVEIKIQR